MEQIIESAKLKALFQWEHINTANEMLDRGETPNQVADWINKNGFSISKPKVYEYVRVRKKLIIDKINMETLINPVSNLIRQPVINGEAVSLSEIQDRKHVIKVKNELQALELIIQRGYATLETEYKYMPIPPKLMMDAIALKNRITDGAHEHLTEYGIQTLKQIEQAKYQILADVVMEYIPEELHLQVLGEIEEAEEEYYRNTDYYQEYKLAREQERQDESPYDEY